QPVDRDPGILQRMPCGFERDPLLRIHRGCLARADPEELSVEPVDTVDKPAIGHGARPLLRPALRGNRGVRSPPRWWGVLLGAPPPPAEGADQRPAGVSPGGNRQAMPSTATGAVRRASA